MLWQSVKICCCAQIQQQLEWGYTAEFGWTTLQIRQYLHTAIKIKLWLLLYWLDSIQKSSNDSVLHSAHCFESEGNTVFQKLSMIPSSGARVSRHVNSWLPQKGLFSGEWVSTKNAELWAYLMGVYYTERVHRSINYGICSLCDFDLHLLSKNIHAVQT